MDEIHSIKVELFKGDIEVQVSEKLDLVDICSDSDVLDIFEKEPGFLVISQKKKNAGMFSGLFGRNIKVDLGLPQKFWERILLHCPSGDITLHPGLACRELEVVTVSGDQKILQAQLVNARLQTNSGDIVAEITSGDMVVHSISGDLELNHCKSNTASLRSVSGDITANVICKDALEFTTTSGDIEGNLAVMPETVQVSSVSGDCSLQVPKESSFILNYKTVSGDISTGDMIFNGIMKTRGGTLNYQNGEEKQVNISTVSGDIRIGSN